ncbi:MAG: hypothetical protein HQ472_10465 [Ignavibacteria bacterium]|nr:hypothetical protein [Ignavibacteria bacterium]
MMFRLLNYTKVRTLLFLSCLCLSLCLLSAVVGAQLVSVTGTGILSATDMLQASASYSPNFSASFKTEPLPFGVLEISNATAMLPLEFFETGLAVQGSASADWLSLKMSAVRSFPLTDQFTAGLGGQLTWQKASGFSSKLGATCTTSVRVQIDPHYTIAFAIADLFTSSSTASPRISIGTSAILLESSGSGSGTSHTSISLDLNLAAMRNVAALFILQHQFDSTATLRTYINTLPLQLGLGIQTFLEDDVTIVLDARLIMHLGLRTSICLEFRK